MTSRDDRSMARNSRGTGRFFAPLRQLAPAGESEIEAAAAPMISSIKRRRVGVSIACNSCRRRKIRCNGQRPTCATCQGQEAACEYRDDTPFSAEAKKLLVETMGILGALPASELIRTVSSLRNETEAPKILAMLRAAGTEPADAVTWAGAATGLFERLDLEAQNPMAYPVLTPFDSTTLRSLTEPVLQPLLTPLGLEMPRHSGSDECILPGENDDPQMEPISNAECSTTVESVGLCDARLKDLDIQRWTNVEIDNDVAARCISLYLVTDHPLLGHFNPELFVSCLVSGSGEYCSPLLVNALLYWACQMYSGISSETEVLATRLCTEAERLWAVESVQGKDSIHALMAAEFLSLGYLGQGRDGMTLRYLAEATGMGVRMRLFGVQDEASLGKERELSPEERGARTYAAWGVFNWISLMCLFYNQPGMRILKHPPQMPIPEGQGDTSLHDVSTMDGPCASAASDSPAPPWYMGETFRHLCRFWRIVHEVSLVYNAKDPPPSGSPDRLLFAEFKFRELLAWSNGLPAQLSQTEGTPHHVQILHLWFHAAILDIFRPGIMNSPLSRLRTFNHAGGTPEAVSAASVVQLKRLIFNFRSNYESSPYSILWHTALIYVANANLENTREEDWYSSLLMCVYGYERLARSWRVAECISKALLSMMLRKSNLSSETARRILRDLENRNWSRGGGDIRATFMADLNLALSDPKSATVESLAEQFEENAMLKQYTNLLDGEDSREGGRQQSESWPPT